MPANKMPEQGRYIDPLVDFAFKKIFGSEPNKDLLIDFLNQVFQGRKKIVDLRYGKTEHPGPTSIIGGAIFDLHCTGPDNEHFIIEVQRGSQQFFKERALFYSSCLISDHAPKGNRKSWGYQLPEVYLVALLDNFLLPDVADNTFLHDICLCDRHTGEIFYDKLNFTFIELNKFVKREAELESDLDKWLFVLRNLGKMDKLPVYLRKPIFEKLFQIAEYTNLSKEEKMTYDSNRKYRWDNENVMEFAIQQAVEKVREEKDKEIEQTKAQLSEAVRQTKLEEALKWKESGIPITTIAKITGVPLAEIEKL